MHLSEEGLFKKNPRKDKRKYHSSAQIYRVNLHILYIRVHIRIHTYTYDAIWHNMFNRLLVSYDLADTQRE